MGVALPFAEGLLEEAGAQLDPAPDPLRAARTGVTAIALGIADYGSVVIQHGGGAEAVSLFPGLHVAVLRAEDVVAGVPEALARLSEAIRTGQGSFVVVTGPSATADMGALVRGAHGPREVHVILLDPDEDAP